ncbi:TPA: hypothetical protein EYP70_00940 [Candidatus Bathyarchaeota archaeon]|nr:hypothetical protein [Candidatus Bathyarchaeota archaeon]
MSLVRELRKGCPPPGYHCESNLGNKVNLITLESKIQIDLSILGEEWSGQAICEYYLIPSEGKVEDKEETIYKVYIQKCKPTDERYSEREIHKATILLRDFGIFQTDNGEFLQCTYHFPACRVNFYILPR